MEKLDFAEKKAFVRRVEVNYFTDANLAVDLKVLDTFKEESGPVTGPGARCALMPLSQCLRRSALTRTRISGRDRLTCPNRRCIPPLSDLFPAASLGGMSPAAVEEGLTGLANLVPRWLPSSHGRPRDLRAVCQVKAPFTGLPTLFLYDNFPGGVGYSREIYGIYREIFQAARRVAVNCRCSDGCPSCVGPSHQVGEHGKTHALQLLEVILS